MMRNSTVILKKKKKKVYLKGCSSFSENSESRSSPFVELSEFYPDCSFCCFIFYMPQSKFVFVSKT